MAKKASPKKISVSATPVVPKSRATPPPPPGAPEPPEVEVRAPSRPVFLAFDEYVRAQPEAGKLGAVLGVDCYKNYIIFPINTDKQPIHLPGGYLFAGMDNYEPGTFKTDRPHYYICIFDGKGTVRKWCYTELEALEALEELTVLTPEDFAQLKQMGYAQE